MCRLRHVNTVCDNSRCEIKACEKRHPKECWWFKQYNMCKFKYCAYRHVQKVDPSADLKAKVESLEEKIKEKEVEIKLQEHSIKEIEMKQKETKLETRIDNLERFVLKLQEQLEQKDAKVCVPERDYNPREAGWVKFDSLVRRDSHELKCEECDYVGRNSVRLKTHIEIHHRHMCELCTENIMDTLFKTKEELVEHNRILHEATDQLLTDEEFENLSETNLECLRRSSANTPKRQDFRERYNLRLKQNKLKL